MDPIDPAFLERAFDRSLPGSPRVERVRGVRDEQPPEEYDQQGRQDGRREPRHQDEEDVYEPSTPSGDPPGEDEEVFEGRSDTVQAGGYGAGFSGVYGPDGPGRPRGTPGSVEGEHDPEQPDRRRPRDQDDDGPHIDITV